jgi:hypothetical protein
MLISEFVEVLIRALFSITYKPKLDVLNSIRRYFSNSLI